MVIILVFEKREKKKRNRYHTSLFCACTAATLHWPSPTSLEVPKSPKPSASRPVSTSTTTRTCPLLPTFRLMGSRGSKICSSLVAPAAPPPPARRPQATKMAPLYKTIMVATLPRIRLTKTSKPTRPNRVSRKVPFL